MTATTVWACVLCAMVGATVGGMLSGAVAGFAAARGPSCGERVAWAAAVAAVCAVIPVVFAPAEAVPPAAWWWALAAHVALAAVSLPLAAIDVAVHRLPDVLVLPAGGVVLVLLAAACFSGAPWAWFARALAAAAALGGFYLVLHLAGRTGMGAGDVKLAVLLGLVLGWSGWDAVVLGGAAAFILGGVFGALLIAARRAGRHTAIAFGPWMLTGAWAGVVAGPLVGA